MNKKFAMDWVSHLSKTGSGRCSKYLLLKAPDLMKHLSGKYLLNLIITYFIRLVTTLKGE